MFRKYVSHLAGIYKASSLVSSLPANMKTKFTFFPRLPLNLRSKVWRCSLALFPRIIELKSMEPLDEHYKRAGPRWLAIPNSKPILLSVNRESRRVLLPYYSAPFQSRKLSPHLGVESLLISYHVDILFMNTNFRSSCQAGVLFRDIFGSNFVEIQDNLKRLACTENFWVTMLQEVSVRRSRNESFRLLNEFTILQEAIVVSQTDFLEQSLPRRLSHLVELPEGDEEWKHLKRELYLSTKNTCARVETLSSSWTT